MSDEPRLKAKIWLQAALRQAQVNGTTGAIVRHGDDDAGSILILLRSRGNALTILDQTRDADGNPAWLAVRRDIGPMDANAHVERAVGRDPDLWIAEFDAEGGIPPFDARVLD